MAKVMIVKHALVANFLWQYVLQHLITKIKFMLKFLNLHYEDQTMDFIRI